MNLQKLFLNAVVGSSLILMFCCSGSKKMITENTESQKEVNYIPYYLKVYEADSLYLTGNYERSFEILDSLFKEYEPLNQSTICEYETYLKLAFFMDDKKINVKKGIEKLISEFGYQGQAFKTDSILLIMIDRYGFNKNDINQYQKLFYNNVNLSLRDSILKMNERDQEYRRCLFDKSLCHGLSKESVDDEIRKNDSINDLKLMTIYKNYGFPGEQMIGGYNLYGNNEYPDLYVLMNHLATSPNYNFYKSKLVQFIKAGKSSPYLLAVMEDKKYFLESKNSDSLMYYAKTNKINAEIIKNSFKTKEVNELRKKMGLPTLQYELWKFQIMFNSK